MKLFTLSFVATLSIVASQAFAAGGCPKDKVENFIKAIETKCGLSNNDAKRIRDNAAICKTYGANQRYKIAVLEKTSDVAVVDLVTCERHRFDVDSSGIAEMVVDGGFAYMYSNDGQLYLVDAKAWLYEVRSNKGRPYGKKNGGAAVTDIKGTGGKGTEVQVSLDNGQTFGLAPAEVINNPNRWQVVPAELRMNGMSIFNDKSVQ